MRQLPKGVNSGWSSASEEMILLFCSFQFGTNAMKSSSKRKTIVPAGRPAYRSLEGWALRTLHEQHAVTECEPHGQRRDRSDPDAGTGPRGGLAGPIPPHHARGLYRCISLEEYTDSCTPSTRTNPFHLHCPKDEIAGV